MCHGRCKARLESELLTVAPALQAASKTNDTAGDGTTTATILSAAIIAEGMKIVAAGTNPIQVSFVDRDLLPALVGFCSAACWHDIWIACCQCC